MNRSVAYVVTPMEMATSATVSNTKTLFACSRTASFSNAACNRSDPR